MSNWSLSSNRAMAARAQLLIGGMRKRQRAAGGRHGRPRAARRQANRCRVNRRIELLILTRQAAAVKPRCSARRARTPKT
jgi:chemotaxis protein MotB